jgi:hypothetical protein
MVSGCPSVDGHERLPYRATLPDRGPSLEIELQSELEEARAPIPIHFTVPGLGTRLAKHDCRGAARVEPFPLRILIREP